ncbi:hypothetical protein R3P38DRAFT_1963845 [Favolaschia claudopus]|uniref:DUF7918 domain-containing protein n=1 Tax=Favolaschia claudopus TaxID=2862362 RepID=A0AAV9ZZQ5_9AGAR
MRLGEFHAWVSTDGIELAEFAVEYSADGIHASCWIPSECGKKLSTHYEGTEPEQPLSLNVEVTVDGIACGSHTLRCLPCLNVASGSRDSVATSAITRRPLMFARQVLTDDDDLLTAAISPELGTIRIEMRDVQSRPHWRTRDSTWNNFSLGPQVLHERSKKAIEHSVQFGDEYLTANHVGDPIEVIQVLATFVFKYRPIELLRAQGIAPRPQARDRGRDSKDSRGSSRSHDGGRLGW